MVHNGDASVQKLNKSLRTSIFTLLCAKILQQIMFIARLRIYSSTQPREQDLIFLRSLKLKSSIRST